MEVSAHPVLTSAIEDIVEQHPGRPEATVTGSLQRDQGDLRQMLTSAAQLWAHGTDVTWPTSTPSVSTLVLPGDDAQIDCAPTETQSIPVADSEPVVFALSAKSESALRVQAGRLGEFLEARPEVDVRSAAGV
ncbi:hypothetical protein DQ392_00005, partial [Streptomyces reniochalinae]